MDKEEIKTILPHRDAMLLVDEAVMTDPVSAKGSYTVKGDEWFLKGHFPGNPVVPGVILCEIMAQTCAVIISDAIRGSTPYFASLDKARFKQKVVPGDKLDISCKVTGQRSVFFFAEAKAKVKGKLAASAQFSFAVVKEEGC